MSIKTNYKDINGNDLGDIFMPLTDNSGIGYNTGYKDISGNDFSVLFLPLGTNYQLPSNTNYKISTGQDLKNIFAAYPVFDASGTFTYTVDSNNNYTVIFTGNGTISFNYECVINIIAVGGGGGGGGGENKYLNSPNIAAGGGGGGGGIGILNNFTINQTKKKYNIIIGLGGEGGNGSNRGNYGGDTSFTDIDLSNYLTATGGGYGVGNFSGSYGGYGGTANSIYQIVSYSSAVGGQGYNKNSEGLIFTPENGSAIIPSLISNPINLSNGTTLYFSGGGGGGNYNAQNYNAYAGGKSGFNGNGGTAGGNVLVNGEKAFSVGSGGGGGGCPSVSRSKSYGGNGANGIVYVYFTYP